MATGPSLGPGDVEDALAAYGPLTDVWTVEHATAPASVTVRLAKTSSAVPYIAPTLAAHYSGALVRFNTGALAGVSGAQWNTTLASVASTPSGTTATFGDAWPTAPASGDQFTVIRAAGIGTDLALQSGTTVSATFSGPVTLASGSVVALESGSTVDVGTIAGAVTLASGATVAFESGSTVDVGTIAGEVTLAAGTTVEVTGSPIVDVSGQSIIIESSNTDSLGASTAPFPPTVAATDVGFYTVSGSAGQYQWQSVVVPLGTSPLPPQGLPVQIVGPWTAPDGTVTPVDVTVAGTPSVTVAGTPSVTAVPSTSRSAAVDVTTIAAGATVDLSLAPTTLWRLTLNAGSTGSVGPVRLQNAAGAWIAVCGVNQSTHIDWSNSGWSNGGNTLQIFNGSADTVTAGVQIEYS